MAGKFNAGEMVRLKGVVPQGPAQAKRYVEDTDTFEYLVKWVDIGGANHERWFAEDMLEAVPQVG